MDIYILRIQSSVNVRLCCFHFFKKIMLLWTLIHKSLCVHMFLFLLGASLTAILLSDMIILFISEELPNCFSQAAVPS